MLGEDLVPDILAVPAIVRPLAHHELVANHTDRKVIRRKRVRLPAHDFGGHVAWRARGLIAIVLPYNPGNAHISDPHVATLLHYRVLRFYVSMDHSLIVDILESLNHAGDDKLRFRF